MDQKKDRPRGQKLLSAVRTGAKNFMKSYITVVGTPKQRRDEINARLNYAATGVGVGLLCFFLGRAELPFSCYVLGAAMLASVSQYAVFAYVGAITSAVFLPTQSLSMFLAYTAAIVMRFGVGFFLKENKKIPIFCESFGYKSIVGVVTMFISGVWRCVSGGFLYYDLIGLILGMILAPIFVWLYCGALEKKHRFTSYHDMGCAAIMASAVFSLTGVTLFGFDAAAIAAFGLSLYISKECGMLRGAVIGLICGLAYKVSLAPLFAITALVSGMFWRMGSFAASGAALASAIIYGIYMDGFSTLSALAPDLLAGSLVFAPLSHFGLLPKPTMYTGTDAVPENHIDITAVSLEKQQASDLRLRAMSDALTSLSEIFYRLSNAQSRPELSSVYAKCENCFNKICKNCQRQSFCWDEHYSDTTEAINKIAQEVCRGGAAKIDSIADHMIRRCNRLEEILSDINKSYSNQLREAISANKAEVFAIDYAAMSKLLEDAMSENSREFEIDRRLTKRIKNTARYLNFTSSNLAVYGNRRKNVIAGGVDLARVKLGVEEIRRAFENSLGVTLLPPSFSVEGNYITMTMRSARCFRTEFSKATMKKEDEDINGDSVIAFENNEDYFYSLLSDGMGSGRDAALSSRLSGIYLERMLRAGNRKAQSIEMLNAFIRQKNCESFATIDLLEVDLLNGCASFVKSGAAPSYVLRGSSLFKIASKTMPIGITREMNAEEVNFKLEDGDVIVMTSDGISASFEDGLWLADMLTNDWKGGITLGEMCERILYAAKEKNEKCDDMTVAMVKVMKI